MTGEEYEQASRQAAGASRPMPGPSAPPTKDITDTRYLTGSSTHAPGQISRHNYYWGGTEHGADDDAAMLAARNAAAQGRTGVQMDTRDADAMLARSYVDRDRQQQATEMYRQQLTGQGASAAQLGGQASLDQALQAQAAMSAQGANAQQLGAAQQMAAGQGAQAMLAGNQHAAAARGQEFSHAAAGYGANVEAMRARDLMSAGMSQDQAMHRAQLEASQRARNDAMAQFYVGQQNDIQRQQLSALQQYQAQRDANYWQNRGMVERNRRAAENAEVGGLANYVSMAGNMLTFGAMNAGKGD